MADLEEFFIEFGEPEGKVESIWFKQKTSKRDKVYGEDVSEAYDQFSIPTWMYGDVTMSELSDFGLGLEYKKMRKAFVTGKSFDDLGIARPVEKDRVKIQGIIYEIMRLREFPLEGTIFLFQCWLMEAAFTVQDEERREEVDKHFEPDSSQAEDETDTTRPASEFEDIAARLFGIISEDFEITSTETDIKISIDGAGPFTVSLTEDSILTAQDIADDLQPLLDTAFGAGIALVIADSGLVIIETVSTGKTSEIELFDVTDNPYKILGFEIGKVFGKRQPVEHDDNDYDEEGNPTWLD